MNSSTQQVRNFCEICEAESIGINFGVRTCMPCKAFFRRNAFNHGVSKLIREKSSRDFLYLIFRLMVLSVRIMVIVVHHVKIV